MSYQATTATRKITELSKKVRAVAGGTSASKTISILLYLIHLAQSDKTPTLTSVISESIPHLKRGAMRDFENIMKEHHYWKEANWNKTDSTYTFETGSKIEFFSADMPDKLRGGRRDRAFFNEANNMAMEAFDEIEVRTKEFIFLDWNPVSEFWFYTEVLPKRTDVEFITLTYKDNEALSPEIVASIEQRMGRKQWWTVYGLGQLGEAEGRIYTGWNIIDEIPHEARLERYGLDFGYAVDPTAIVALYKYNGGYILDEVAYTKGLSNKQIADILINLQRAIVVADSAEPKSIDELRVYGVTVVPATKGPGSVNQGIQAVQAQRISVTKQSVNIIKEYRNYMWLKDKKTSRVMNEPDDLWNHSMDACFAPQTKIKTTNGNIPIVELVGKEGYLYSRNGKIRRFSNVRQTRDDSELLTVHFDDGEITVTPDHLFLLSSGEWKEARLLVPTDMIQCATYGNNLQWGNISAIFRRALFFKGEKKTSPRCVGVSQREDTQGKTCSPQGQEPTEQRHIEPRTERPAQSSFGAYDTRAEKLDERTRRKNQAPHQEVAWITGRDGVAQKAWIRGMEKHQTRFEKLRSLWGQIFHQGREAIRALLWPELQNESQTKKVARITRESSRSPVYNLEVEDTHCLVAEGVVAHNCRYAISSLAPIIERQTYLYSFQQSTYEEPPNPAR